jgi:hypothetical protein
VHSFMPRPILLHTCLEVVAFVQQRPQRTSSASTSLPLFHLPVRALKMSPKLSKAIQGSSDQLGVIDATAEAAVIANVEPSKLGLVIP